MESNQICAGVGKNECMSSLRTNSVATVCFHCGQDVVDSTFTGDEKAFCCAGCLSVYQILRGANLGSYYQVGDKAGTRPTGDDTSRFLYLDDPAITPRLLDYIDSTRARVTFAVPQIHCSACIWLLEHLGRLEPAVRRSTVDFLARRLTVEYSPSATSLSKIVSLLARLGYEPDIKLDRVDPIPVKNPNTSLYIKIGVAGFSFANIMLFSFPEYLSAGHIGSDTISTFFRYANLFLSIPVLLYSALDFFSSAIAGLRQRHLNLDVPISIGLLALFGRSFFDVVTNSGPGYFDSFAGLVLFLLAGRLFQRKTYQWLSFDRDYRAYFPIAVRRKRGTSEETVAVGLVGVGDRVVIRNQELIPADGILMAGPASIDYSFVTGESDPQVLMVGERVYAGGRQVGGAIEVEVIKSVEESYLVSLWSGSAKNHPASKSTTEKILSTVSAGIGRYFTFGVLVIAALTAWWWLANDPSKWTHAFTSVLIVACPCAIALSAPFVFGTTMRIFGNQRLFLRHPDVIDALSRIDTIVFDKTGTLTGSMEKKVSYEGSPLGDSDMSAICALAGHSTHPASRAVASLARTGSICSVSNFDEIPGSGIKGEINGQTYRLGRREFVMGDFAETLQQDLPSPTYESGVHVSVEGKYLGRFSVTSPFREGLDKELAQLSKTHELAVLTGDSEKSKADLQKIFGPHTIFSFNQLPHDKRRFVDSLKSNGKKVLMLGDGLNDSGALGAADVGLAVSEDTSAFAPACDGILHAGHLSQLSRFLRASQTARRIVYVSFGISLFYNIIGIGFAASGHLSPLVSAVLMPVSSVSVVGFGTTAAWFAARRKGLA